MKSDNTALKVAIVEGMSAMLAAIDNADDPAPQAAVPPTKSEKPKRKSKKKAKSYRVEDLRGLYSLANAELLHCIKGMMPSTDYPGTNVFFVERTPETKAALAPFLTREEIEDRV